MCLTLRPLSLNCYCSSKLWFKCGSIDLRVADIKKITSNMRSWLFADQLEHPEELVLYRPRKAGGLGLYSIKYRAMAELIRSFLETAVNPSFKTNQYHLALFKWNVEEVNNIPTPTKNPYMSEEMFSNIKLVRDEGLLKISKLSIGDWYKVLLENNITMITKENGTRAMKPCRVELNNPSVDWEVSWRLAVLPGLSSEDQTFLWRMLHNLLPTQERLHKMKIQSAPSPICILCDKPEPDQLHHALVTCQENKEVADWLFQHLNQHVPSLNPQQLVVLDLGSLHESLELPIVWLTAQVLSYIWKSRKEKKKPKLYKTRAMLEAGVSILRKTRFQDECDLLETILSN